MKLQLKTLLFVFLCFSLITVFLKNTDYSFAKEGDSNNEFEEDSTNFYRDESILKAEADDSSDDEIKDSDSDDSKDLLVNDLVDVSQSVSDIKNSALETKVDVIDKFEKGISKLIQEIENSLPREVGRIERLNKLIESERIYVLKQINDTFSESNVVEDNKIDDLNIKIEEALKRIKKILEENSGEKVEIDNVSGQIKNSLEDYNDDVLDSEVERERLRINMLYEDSDDDKVSDYDEVHIYGTDPNNSKTVPGDLLDGDKILLGLNPTDATFGEVKYEDPNISGEYVSDIFTVTAIQYVDNFEGYATGTPSGYDVGSSTPTIPEEKVLVFTGTAIPNSFVTLYIYSTPIVVTVKTDNEGEWVYALDRELENGDHTMYVASVNNSGKIIAKSNPIPFVKTATAAGIRDRSLPRSSQSFWQENYSFILRLIFIVTIVGGVALIGVKKTGPDGGLNA